MYVEAKKSRYGRYYILRVKESEKEDAISDIEFMINTTLKEEFREEYKHDIVRLIRKCEHDEKYDNDGETSCILKDNEVYSFLHCGFNLLACGADGLLDAMGLIETQSNIIETQSNIIETQSNIIEMQSERYESESGILDESDGD